MRGIIFTGGGLPDLDGIMPWLEPYAFVVAADSGLLGAEQAGVYPDMVIGDMDSLGDLGRLEKYSSEKKRLYAQDKDFSDTELAMAVMAEKGIDDIVLVGGDGGRMDHFFALLLLFEKAVVPSLWIGRESVVFAIGTGTVSSAIRISGLTSADPVSIFAVAPMTHSCRGYGFHWLPDGLAWDKGVFSLSNRADDGTVELTSLEGRFLLVVPYRPGIQSLRM